jgi:hypothetical protein
MQPPPYGGWQQPPPPGGWQAPPPGGGGSGTEFLPPDDTEAKPANPNLTKAGLPIGMRGGLRLEIARVTSGRESYGYGTMDVLTQFPIAERVFFDGRLPMAFGNLGNPMIGVHGVSRPSERLWITVGGAFGLPLVGPDDEAAGSGSFAQAWWNSHHYAVDAIPLLLQLGLEGHAGDVALFRVELDPVLIMRTEPRGSEDAVDMGIQHAVEAQFGHTMGGGLRFQGVWLATAGRNDNYQLAVEPFFVVERESLFLRLGLLLPFNEPLDFIFDDSSGNAAWGVRAATGIHLD